jgi:hypothetical protein
MIDPEKIEKPSRIFVSEPLTGPLPPGWEDVHVCVIRAMPPPAKSDLWPLLHQAFSELLRRAIRVILRR